MKTWTIWVLLWLSPHEKREIGGRTATAARGPVVAKPYKWWNFNMTQFAVFSRPHSSFHRSRRQWDGGLGPSRARLKWRLSAPRHDQGSLRRLARARAQRRPRSQCDFLSNQRPLLYRLGL